MSVIRHRPVFRSSAQGDSFRKFGAYERILLLTQEKVWREVKEPLEESFFNVHVGGNGLEAMEEIMHHDFDAVICDTGLRNFPWKIFYEAVERIRPHLLQRFVFLVDSRTDEKTVEFIERIDGLKIWRALSAGELFQTIEIVLGQNKDLAHA